MKVGDAIVGAVLVVFAAAILLHIQSYPPMPGQKFGPAVFPGIIAAGLAVCGVLLLARGLRERQALLELAPWARSPALIANFVCIVAALLAYIFLSDALGFVLTGTLLLAALFWRFGARPALAVPVGLVATLAIHTVFYKLLKVPLPWGMLQRFAW